MCACRLYGRVKAYQFRMPDAFFQHTANSLGINEAYLSGISITLGGTLGMPPHSGGMDATHISFSAGATQSTADAAIMDNRCPCDTGSPSPTFVGEDYFCESAIEDDISSDLTQFDSTFFFRDCLWDGDGCADSNNVTRGSITHILSKIWLPQLQRISISVSVVIMMYLRRALQLN